MEPEKSAMYVPEWLRKTPPKPVQMGSPLQLSSTFKIVH